MQPNVDNNKCLFISSVFKKRIYFLVVTKGKMECKCRLIIFSIF